MPANKHMRIQAMNAGEATFFSNITTKNLVFSTFCVNTHTHTHTHTHTIYVDIYVYLNLRLEKSQRDAIPSVLHTSCFLSFSLRSQMGEWLTHVRFCKRHGLQIRAGGGANPLYFAENHFSQEKYLSTNTCYLLFARKVAFNKHLLSTFREKCCWKHFVATYFSQEKYLSTTSWRLYEGREAISKTLSPPIFELSDKQ